MKCRVVVTFCLLNVAFRMPQSTLPPTMGKPTILHEITTEPTVQAMTTSSEEPWVRSPWGPTPVGFFVVPSLFQKDFEKLTTHHKEQRAALDAARAELTTGTTDIRLLIKNLEVCARHFGPHEPVMKSAETIDIMLSCKEALSSLFRWRRSQELNEEILHEGNPRSYSVTPDNRHVQGHAKGHASHELSRRAQAVDVKAAMPPEGTGHIDPSTPKSGPAALAKTFLSPAEPMQTVEKMSKSAKRCQLTLCDSPLVKKRCHQSWALEHKSREGVCKICFLKDEAQINAYCLKQIRREKAAFFLVGALIILSIVTLVTVIFVKDMRRKRNVKRVNDEVLPDGIESRLNPLLSGGSRSNYQASGTFAGWKALYQKLSNWLAKQKPPSWLPHGKRDCDVENGGESSCDSFKAEEMLMSPFDYAPRTGKFFSSAPSELSRSSNKTGYGSVSLQTPAALVKTLSAPQLPPLKVPIIRLFARTSSVEQDDEKALENPSILNRRLSMSRTSPSKSKSNRRRSSKTA